MPLEQLTGWEVVNGHHLRKVYKFPDFKQALGFVDRIGDVAEAHGHHPELRLGWGKVEVELFTHTAHGITERDYTLAAAIDQIL
jgi:4a-hydroxytetrahydrobiopterin dehydratase